MSELRGILTGLPNHPTIRRTTPRRFQRPSADLTPVKREWRQVPAGKIQPGDNVPGIGVVSTVTELGMLPGDRHTDLRVYGGEGNVKLLRSDEPVFCFCRVDK